jgi:hypothetical protein
MPTHKNGFSALPKGSTYADLYGPERAAEIKRKIAQTLSGHKHSPNRRPSRLIPVVNVSPEGKVTRYEALRYAARAEGCTINTIKWRISQGASINGRWFHAEDTELWQRYVATINALRTFNTPALFL